MMSVIKTMNLDGLNGYLVDVQTDISSGVPSFNIVGLPDTSIKEAKERVRASIKNMDIVFPNKKILVNLAPADKRKEGTFFDLPIALGILMALGRVKKDRFDNFEETLFLGELSLSGKVNRIKGVLPMCIEAKDLGIRKIIVPKANAREAAVVNNVEIIPVSNLKEVVDYINGDLKINPQIVDVNIILNDKSKYNVDFKEVKGQENVKRALEIAAGGGHNCLLIGSPGSGKSMIAQRFPTILPDLTFEESLEITKIHSIAGNIEEGGSIIGIRPFRNPHHTASPASIIGGGLNPKPGEISLAHYGVLFLDEIPEFNRNALEVLRGPLEDGKVTISRLNSTVTYPCNFTMIASMNPCPCGYYGTDETKCMCTPQAINKYIGRISQPLLDRIDIHVEVKPVEYKKLDSEDEIEDSKEIKRRVDNARKIQLERYKGLGIISNSELTPELIEKYCILDKKSRELLKTAFDRLGLSARAYNRILKVSRTIADLEDSENILFNHVAEAIQYRSLDRKYWNSERGNK